MVDVTVSVCGPGVGYLPMEVGAFFVTEDS